MASFRGERGQVSLTGDQRFLHSRAVSNLNDALSHVGRAEWWMRISDTRRRFPQFVKDFADRRASRQIELTGERTAAASHSIRRLARLLQPA